MGKVHMDMLRRQMFRDAEVSRLVLKSITMSSRVPTAVRAAATRQLAEMPRNSSHTRIRLRCIVTGRARSVFRDSGLSRIAFRDLARLGKLPGVWKAR